MVPAQAEKDPFIKCLCQTLEAGCEQGVDQSLPPPTQGGLGEKDSAKVQLRFSVAQPHHTAAANSHPLRVHAPSLEPDCLL